MVGSQHWMGITVLILMDGNEHFNIEHVHLILVSKSKFWYFTIFLVQHWSADKT